jgi:magnesium transporter
VPDPLPRDIVEAPDESDELVLRAEGRARKDAAGGDSRITTLLLDADGVSRSTDPRELPEMVRQGGDRLVWVDLSEYAEPQLRHVTRSLGIGDDAVQSALAPWERPHVDLDGQRSMLSITVPRTSIADRSLTAGQLDLFIGPGYLVSAHKVEVPFLDHVRTRLEHTPGRLRHHSGYVMYVVLDEWLQHLVMLLEETEDEIERTEELALRQTDDPFLEDVVRLKRYVFLLGRLLEQHHGVLAALTRPDFPHGGEDIEPHYREVQERLRRVRTRFSEARDDLKDAFQIYVSHVSHQTNQVIKLLTIVSTVLLPGTVIVGFFGTNFTDLAFLRSTAGFVVMLAALLVAPAGLLVALRLRLSL